MWKTQWIAFVSAAVAASIFIIYRWNSAPLRGADETKAELSLQARAFFPPRAVPHAPARSSASGPSSASASASASAESERPIEAKLKALSLEQKVGQMFIVGFGGERIDRGLGDAIKANRPGAIIVFGRNVKSAEQVSKLAYAAQLASFDAVGLPLLVAVDQEGGNVIRIRTAPPLPSALALGDTRDPKLVQDAGKRTGRLLRSLGFNMNLAPVMDVTDPARDKFIGTRAFGDDPRVVTQMASAFAQGLQGADVFPTGKHFPGHGGLNADSHLGTPVKRAPLADLLKRDLVPFSDAAHWPMPPAVMIAHVAYPMIDASGLPATFSKPIVTDILRKRLGFEGVVMTDDIEMAGAAAIGDVNERAVRAIEAGVDLVMIGWNRSMQRNLPRAVVAAVKSGRVSEARIDESVRRLLRAKSRYASFERPKAPNRSEIAAALNDPALRSISERVLRSHFDRAAAALDRRFLEEHADAPVFVFSAAEGFFKSFKAEAGERAARFYRLDVEGGLNIDRVMRSNPEAIGVFYVSGVRSAKLANAISPDVASRLILVNSEARSALDDPDSFRLVVDVFFRHALAGRMTADLLFPGTAPAAASRAPEPRAPAAVGRSKR